MSVVLLGVVGAWVGWAFYDGRAQNGLTMPPLAVIAMLIGGALLAPIPYLTGIGERLARPNAEFWSVPPGLARFGITLSLGICLALGWDMLVIVSTT